jgi:serine O-acetyltransferase
MEMSMPRDALEKYLTRLLHAHIPDGYEAPRQLGVCLDLALDRVEHCFSRIERKYYRHEDKLVFDHLNGDHMATLLYFLGNTLWRETGDPGLPTRLFYLNKIMHGLDLFYSVRMPEVFLLVHPIGTVLGNASYGDYLVVYQNCTVGAVTDVYPRFGTGTILYSRSSVLGDCQVGNNVVFAANAQIVNVGIPDDSLVLGQYPQHRIARNDKTVRQRCFDAIGG